MRRARADSARVRAPSPQGALSRKPLWPFLLLRAPTVPSRVANHNTPWARTLPRGKKSPAQFPARLGHAAPALAGAQAASAKALSGTGYWSAGGGWEVAARSAHASAGWAMTEVLGDGDLSLPLGLALGSPIFPSGCEGKLGVALESLQGLRDLT